MKWNGTSWVTVGSADFAGNSTLSRLAFDPIRGIPYLLVTDENQKISVKSPVIVLGTATAVQMDISAGNVSVNSPTTVSFPGATASNALQTLNVSAGTFSVQDLKGASAGYYATISISDLTSGSKTIPKANVTATVSGGTVTKIAGYDNASVTVPTSGGTI